jgi:hypothetical protein
MDDKLEHQQPNLRPVQTVERRTEVGVNPPPPVPPPGGIDPAWVVGTLLVFATGTLFPRVFGVVEKSKDSENARRDREMAARQEIELREYKLLEELISANRATTDRLVASNEATAQELRGLKEAVMKTNEFMMSEFSNLRDRVVALESRK